jgi:uncharacterized repeat protein (TIGR03803 family)
MRNSIWLILTTACFLSTSFQIIAASDNHGDDGNGCYPCAGLVLVDDELYGVTESGAGGFWGYGTVFRVKTDGRDFTVLHRFAPLRGTSPRINDEGAFPRTGLVQFGSSLYGTTAEGGKAGGGTIFRILLDGSGFGVLHHFSFDPKLDRTDGVRPMSRLVVPGGMLYGITQRGGRNEGVIFKLKTDGSDYEGIHKFSKLADRILTNSDGAFSESKLVLLGDWLYGAACSGGAGGRGTIFKLSATGGDFQTLHNFSKGKNNQHGHDANADGAWPDGELIAAGDWLYSTARQGGAYGNGTVYRLKQDGSSFQVLHEFSESGNNLDGSHPGALIASGGTIYGTTSEAAKTGWGTVFKMNTDGSEFKTLHDFAGNDGASPRSSLRLEGIRFMAQLPSAAMARVELCSV